MMEKECDKEKKEKVWMVREEQVSYQSQIPCGIIKNISQTELDAECFTLEESKRRILEKIHRHFHQS